MSFFGAAAVEQLIKADVLALPAPRDSRDDEYTHYMPHSDSELHEHGDQHFDTPGCCCRSWPTMLRVAGFTPAAPASTHTVAVLIAKGTEDGSSDYSRLLVQHRGEPLLLHYLLPDTDADRDAKADADSGDEEPALLTLCCLLTICLDADIALHLLCRSNVCFFVTRCVRSW